MAEQGGTGGTGGTEASFREFVLLRSSALHRSAWLLTGDEHSAEDLVQAVLLAVWPRWSRIARGGDGEAYVRRALFTTYVSWWRRRSWHERPAGTAAETAGDGARPLAAESGAEVRLVVARALQALPRRQRAVLALRYFDDLSEAQTAHVLDISTSSVKTHAARGLAALRAGGLLADLTEDRA